MEFQGYWLRIPVTAISLRLAVHHVVVGEYFQSQARVPAQPVTQLPQYDLRIIRILTEYRIADRAKKA